ncbi:hypothetical protein AB0I49_12195 [Streptomyces sp. NPDC050617]|uniref:hypothetical protein n=1 Tax=Streptomyces sp. NPDC050617 TaxID=3154628 RepID=UPI003429A8F4
MPRSRRSFAVTALLFLLAALFVPKPCALAAAHSEPAARTGFAAAVVVAEPPGPSASVPGKCTPDQAPARPGPDVAVAHPHADPLPGPGVEPLPYTAPPLPPAGGPRAPPLPVAGCAELLPVLRI